MAGIEGVGRGSFGRGKWVEFGERLVELTAKRGLKAARCAVSEVGMLRQPSCETLGTSHNMGAYGGCDLK